MFDENDIIEIKRFEVGAIVNNNRYIIYVTNDIEQATIKYEQAVSAHFNFKDHIIIFLYDYDKNANINYYDSEVD